MVKTMVAKARAVVTRYRRKWPIDSIAHPFELTPERLALIKQAQNKGHIFNPDLPH